MDNFENYDGNNPMLKKARFVGQVIHENNKNCDVTKINNVTVKLSLLGKCLGFLCPFFPYFKDRTGN